MLTVRNIKVRSLSTDYAHILWQIETTAEDPALYRFYVLRSGGQAGPYDIISGPLVDTYIWRDNTARERGFWRPLYYRIRVESIETGETTEWGSRSPEEIAAGFDPGGVSKEPEPTIIAREIIYRTRLLIRTRTGRQCFVYQARKFGQRCPSCWDSIKQKRKLDYCQLCYGTTFVGGFYTPIQVYIQEGVDAPENDVLTTEGRRQVSQSFFLASNFPELAPRDMIIDSENNRWRVNTVSPSYFQGTLLSQIIGVSAIIKSDIEYKVPVPGVDILRFEALDERQYTEPTDPDSITIYQNRFEPREI